MSRACRSARGTSPRGLSARVVPAVVRVSVRGQRDALAAIRPDSIDAFVDLAGLGPGSYSLRVQVDPSEEFGVGTVIAERRRSHHQMSVQRLFGTDGVRGTAGDYPLDHATVARLGAALVRAMQPAILEREGDRAAPSAPLRRRPRYARVRRLDRAGARARRGIGGGERHERRRHPDARDRVCHAGDGLRRRHRDLGLAQSVRRQRHQGVLGQGREVHRGARARSRSDRRPDATGPCRRRPTRALRPYRTSSTSTWRTRGWRFPIRAACAARRSPSTRPTARRPRLRRGCSRSWASICVELSGVAGRPQHQSRVRIDASRGPVARRTRAAVPDGRGVRRRRRSRDLRRRRRAHRRRRRRAADVRAPPQGATAA